MYDGKTRSAVPNSSLGLAKSSIHVAPFKELFFLHRIESGSQALRHFLRGIMCPEVHKK